MQHDVFNPGFTNAPIIGNRVTAMRVEQLTLRETGGYNPMYHRPYQSHLDAGMLNAITQRVEQVGSGRISGQLLSGIAGSILSPSAVIDPTQAIAIPYGWNERRIRFVLKLQCLFSLGTEVQYLIQGYTDYPGVSIGGAVDPNMQFIINSVVVVGKNTVAYGPTGYNTLDRMVENYQVMADPTWQNVQQMTQARLMRPQDIFGTMQDEYLRGATESYLPYGDQVYDPRSVLRSDPQKSTRGNNLPGNYIGRVVDAFYTSSQLSEFGQGNADILSKSRETVMETPISDNPFVRWLGERRMQPSGYQFSLPELEELDPNTRAVTNYIQPGQMQQVSTHQPGLTSYWTGADRCTVVATHLSQAVPALMMDLLISKVVLRSTNDALSGLIDSRFIEVRSLTGADMRRHYDLFLHRLETEVIQDFTFNGQELYHLDIQADIFGETWITLSLAGQPAVTYVAPSFCDNLFAPVIAQNQNQLDHLAHDMESLINNVNEAVSGASLGGQTIHPYV